MTTPPIAIIVAMDSERRHLEGAIPGWEQATDHHWPVMRTRWRGMSLVLVTSGIGMVRAAAATEYALLRHQPRAILNFGCAGAHRRDILPGDVVIGTDLVTHGRMRMSAGEGIVALPSSFTVEGEPAPVAGIACDPALVSMATASSSTLALPAWPEAHRLDAHRPGGIVTVHAGPVASADVWLQDPTWLDATHHRTGSLCEDMEAAAIGTICALHGIPFLTVKDISNNEFHALSAFEGTESELPVEEVGKRAAMVIMAVLERMAGASA